MNLGNLEYILNNIDTAEDYYIKALKLKNNNIDALKNLTTIYAKKNEKEKYNEVVKILKQYYPKDSNVESLSLKK